MKQLQYKRYFLMLALVMFFVSFLARLNGAEEMPATLEIDYAHQGKRDPFIPLIGKNVQIKNVDFFKTVDEARIEGILIDPKEGSVVIVNDQVLKLGDFIGGFRIDKIEANVVVFSRDGETFRVAYGSEN